LQLASALIGKPDRANWKNCVLDENGEMELATNFRQSFERFDFSLNQTAPSS
jgi:hypothetical protein